MDPRLIDWIAERRGLAALVMFAWRAAWLIGLLLTFAFLGAALALGVFGVGGHDMAGRLSVGALLTFMGIMVFAIGSLARLSTEQLRRAVQARRPGDAARFLGCPACR